MSTKNQNNGDNDSYDDKTEKCDGKKGQIAAVTKEDNQERFVVMPLELDKQSNDQDEHKEGAAHESSHYDATDDNNAEPSASEDLILAATSLLQILSHPQMRTSRPGAVAMPRWTTPFLPNHPPRLIIAWAHPN
jgi:hypothetical protein